MTRVTDIAKRPIPLQLGDLKTELEMLKLVGWQLSGEQQRRCRERIEIVKRRIALIENNRGPNDES